MKEKYLEDIREVREIMSRSARIVSLSGFSGIAAGITALAGTYAAHHLIFSNTEYLNQPVSDVTPQSVSTLLLLALSTILIASGLSFYFTQLDNRKKGTPLNGPVSFKLLVTLLIPLIGGGILCLLLLFQGIMAILPGLTMIFYGIALTTANSYTYNDIRSLGILEITLGLLAVYFTNYALIIWAIGFGLLHIIYGFVELGRNRK